MIADKIVAEIEPQITDIVKQAPQSMMIANVEQANTVAAYRETVRAARKKVTEFFKPLKDSLNEAKDQLMKRIHSCEDPLIELQDKCDTALSVWTKAEERRVQAEQDRLDAEARKQAAKEAKESGDKRLAQQITSGKVAVVSSAVARPVDKVAGVSMIDRWDADCTDLMALVKGVAAGKVPLNYVVWNEQVIKGIIRSSKGQCSIPGITPRKVAGVSGRG